MVLVITSDGLAILGVVFIPPRLAFTRSRPAGGVGGDAIPVGVTSSTGLFRLRWRCTLVKPVSPTHRTQRVVLRWGAYWK